MTQLARQFEEHPEVRYGITACASASAWAARSSGRTRTGTAPRAPTAPRETQVSTEQNPLATEQFPDEVVTKALVQFFDLPAGAGRFALITLDNGFDHTKPNTFGPGGLIQLGLALDEGEARREAGRDRRRRRHRQAVHLRRRRRPQGRRGRQGARRGAGHRPGRPRRLHAAQRAAGALLRVRQRRGHGRRRSRSPCTAPTGRSPAGVPALALPECFLGLVPGWGGCTPAAASLIGPDAAVTVIIENPLSARTACSRAPRRSSSASPTSCSSRPTSWSGRCIWAGKVVTGAVTVERPAVHRRGLRGRRRPRPPDRRLQAARRGPGPVPGPGHHRRHGRPPPRRGFAAEDEALADLIMTDELRAGPVRVRPGPAAGQASPPARRTRRWPGRSPRSASSAPA